MATPDDVLRVARGELGVSESPPESNRQKYGQAYGMNGVAWCAIWVWWVYREATGIDLRDLTSSWAYTPAGLNAARARGWTVPVADARPSDVVFYDFHKGTGDPVEHVGIVESNNPGAGQLVALEGNTSGSSNANGGQVQRRTRSYGSVVGVMRHPNLGAAQPALPPMDPEQVKAFRKYVAALLGRDVAALPDLRQGQRGGNVQTLQKALNLATGSSLAQDGDFGPATATVVKNVQRIFGLGVDGIVGPRTRSAILTALKKIEVNG